MSKFARFNWDAVSTATGYNLYLDSGAGFVKNNTSPITGTTYDTDVLDPGSYEAYVTALRSVTESSPSDSISFNVDLVPNLFPTTISSIPGDMTILGTAAAVGDEFEIATHPTLSGNALKQVSTANHMFLVDATESENISLRGSIYTPDFGAGTRMNFGFFESASKFVMIELSGSFGMWKYDSGFTNLDSATATFASSTWYEIKFEKEGNTYRAKWWERGSAEPGTWQLEATDSLLTLAKVGVGARANSSQGNFCDTLEYYTVIPA